MSVIDVRSRSQLQEQLVSLYLRLNGFFVTGFIVHSPLHGQNRAELDALALRLPYNCEPERQIGPDPMLELSEKYTDLAVCEVKSKGQQLQFNQSLVQQSTAAATILRWAGLFRESEVIPLADSLAQALAPSNPAARPNAPTVLGPQDVRIRGLLFSPERDSRRPNQPWFISGPQLFDYIWRCLCPANPRQCCATTYDFQLWGDHEAIARYFKSRGPEGPGDISALYAYVEQMSGGEHR
ncbi:MAG: hypothetical protein AB7Q97_25635 [Gammaproteobacteria bacterium]